MRLLLAPMEGLLDFVLRDVLTRVGGADRGGGDEWSWGGDSASGGRLGV